MAAPKPVSTTGAKSVLMPARRSWRPIAAAMARASAGSPRLPTSAAGCGATQGAEAMSPPLLVDGDEERHSRFRLDGELLEPAGQRLDLTLALHVVAEEDHTADIPLSHYLLDVVVGLRAAHADDEHLTHHVPDAHPRHCGRYFILAISGGILVVASRRTAFHVCVAASRQDKE